MIGLWIPFPTRGAGRWSQNVATFYQPVPTCRYKLVLKHLSIEEDDEQIQKLAKVKWEQSNTTDMFANYGPKTSDKAKQYSFRRDIGAFDDA